MAVVDAATWLFVSGNTPHRFDKAVAAGADAVILDLEDAVQPEDKPAARDDVVGWLNHHGSAWVRVNGVDTAWFDDDVEAVAAAAGLVGVIVPKAEDPSLLDAVASRLGPAASVVALIETAVGVHRAHQIAGARGVARLAFGSLDFAADLRADDTHDALLLARSTIVLASRVGGLAGPIDGVSTVIHDCDVVEQLARRARGLGFCGKLCIHPAQIAPTARGLGHSEREIAWAQDVLRATEGSAGAVTGTDGQMIDKPVVDRARTILGL